MSEEKKNTTGLKKPGRPRKNVPTNQADKASVEDKITAASAEARSNDESSFEKSKTEKPSRRPAASAKKSTSSKPRTKSSEETSPSEPAKPVKPRTKKEPLKSKRAHENESEMIQDIFDKRVSRSVDNKSSSSKFEHVSESYVLDITRENKEKEVTSTRRKPGRPAKKQNNKPILSLEVPSQLSIETRGVKAIEAHESLAIQSHGRKALNSDKHYALEESAGTHLPATPRTNEIFLEKNPENLVEQSVQGEARTARGFGKSRGYKAKGHNTRQNSLNRHREKPEDTQATDRHVTDFVAGVNGTSAYVGSETLGEYGEKAALGVMGIIDEAPMVDALLPLVSDADNEKDARTSRRSRSRRRSREKPSKPLDQVGQKDLEEQAECADFNSDYDDAPIAEGGELSLLEAEVSVKKYANRAKKESALKAEDVTRVLYVSSVPDEQVEVVITENGVVSEYFVEMAHQAKIRGNIYKGVINNVDTNLQAAFVNFGCGKNGFLQIDEVHPEYWLTHHTEGGKYPPIQKVLKVGQEILVQVVKEPSGSKGAFLTTWISLAGRFIVLTPGQEQIGVSRKVEDNVERARLRDLLVGINPGEDMGVIIRTASEGASKANIQNDLKFLKRAWKEIQKKVVTEDAPSLIYQEADLASRAVRDYLSEDIDEVWVDSEEVRDALNDLVSIIFPKNKSILRLHKDTRNTLWERFNILRQLEEVTKREVILPSGGRLVFDQTEALMAIDINSGKTQGKTNFESMVFRTNMEAVEAIARHLRLRDIGGQVVIDFIEMRDRGHCREVEKCMRNSMKRDRARHDVGRLSSFGLLELVRQRTGTSAISISSEPCPHCRGTGFRRNLEWQAQGVLREIKSKLSGKNLPTCYVHNVEHEVAFYLLNKKRDRLSELENKFDVKIEINVK